MIVSIITNLTYMPPPNPPPPPRMGEVAVLTLVANLHACGATYIILNALMTAILIIFMTIFIFLGNSKKDSHTEIGVHIAPWKVQLDTV